MSEFEFDCLRLDQQLCFPLYAAARKVTGQYTPYFKELGLTYTQYIVFMALWEKDGRKRLAAADPLPSGRAHCHCHSDGRRKKNEGTLPVDSRFHQ